MKRFSIRDALRWSIFTMSIVIVGAPVVGFCFLIKIVDIAIVISIVMFLAAIASLLLQLRILVEREREMEKREGFSTRGKSWIGIYLLFLKNSYKNRVGSY
jgi:uncharacterized membrane protein YhaH (DUF805 family)